MLGVYSELLHKKTSGPQLSALRCRNCIASTRPSTSSFS